MKSQSRSGLAALLLAVSFASCTSYKTVPYFQDLADPAAQVTLKNTVNELRVEPGDRLQIIVHSALAPDLSENFNIKATSGSNMSYGSSNGNNVLAYHVDEKGNIDFPVLGKIRVQGMTRDQIQKTIKDLLIEKRLLDEVVVNCVVLNHYVNVIGDAKSVGRIAITEDHLTLVELLAQCGDLTVTGERQNVMVLRKEGDEFKPHFVDLTKAEDVYNSEVFYLQPDDVVYINPNKTKQRSSMAVGNMWATPATYIGLLGTVMSVSTFIVSFVKK